MSGKFGRDPAALVEHYLKLEGKRYAGRHLRPAKALAAAERDSLDEQGPDRNP